MKMPYGCNKEKELQMRLRKIHRKILHVNRKLLNGKLFSRFSSFLTSNGVKCRENQYHSRAIHHDVLVRENSHHRRLCWWKGGKTCWQKENKQSSGTDESSILVLATLFLVISILQMWIILSSSIVRVSLIAVTFILRGNFKSLFTVMNHHFSPAVRLLSMVDRIKYSSRVGCKGKCGEHFHVTLICIQCAVVRFSHVTSLAWLVQSNH